MDRIMPNRRRTALLLAMTLTLAVWPTTGGHAKPLQMVYDTAGDPGDGVLRPSDAPIAEPATDVEATKEALTSSTPEASRLSGPFILVPHFAAPGQPWSLTFRMVRLEQFASSAWRWHRAP